MNADGSLLDHALFDDFAGLFDREEMRDVMKEWHADVAHALQVIDDARQRDDAAEVARVAHRTAGGGLALGATSLAEACERLRERAEAGIAVTAEDVDGLRRAAEATRHALSEAARL